MKKHAVKNNKVEKHVSEETFKSFQHNYEKSMLSIAKSFENQGKVMEMMLKEIHAIRVDYKEINKTLNNFVIDISFHERKIDNLTMRVEKLETRMK